MSKHGYAGFIKLDRRILDWEHFKDPKTLSLFITLLLLANHKTVKMDDGTVLKRGQVMTSLKSLSYITGLSFQEIRTRLLTMSSTKELTNLSSSKNRIITLINYDKYQTANKAINKENNKEINNKQEVNNSKELFTKENIRNGGGASCERPAENEWERFGFSDREEYERWRYQ